MSHREEALARNESLFRDINETVEGAALEAGVRGEIVFVCECGDDSCAEEIRLTVDEYERVRAGATRFVVRPGHFTPVVEVIVEQTTHYWIVEKKDEAADIARETDPRP